MERKGMDPNYDLRYPHRLTYHSIFLMRPPDKREDSALPSKDVKTWRATSKGLGLSLLL